MSHLHQLFLTNVPHSGSHLFVADDVLAESAVYMNDVMLEASAILFGAHQTLDLRNWLASHVVSGLRRQQLRQRGRRRTGASSGRRQVGRKEAAGALAASEREQTLWQAPSPDLYPDCQVRGMLLAPPLHRNTGVHLIPNCRRILMMRRKSQLK